MTLPRLDSIVAHWAAVPPLAVSVAAIAHVMGVGRAEKSKQPTSTNPKESDPSELLAMLGAAGFGTEKPSWLTTPM